MIKDALLVSVNASIIWKQF